MIVLPLKQLIHMLVHQKETGLSYFGLKEEIYKRKGPKGLSRLDIKFSQNRIVSREIKLRKIFQPHTGLNFCCFFEPLIFEEYCLSR